MTQDSSYITPVDDEYSTCERTFAELRIYGDNLDPDVITASLAIEPSGSQRKGEIRCNSRGAKRTISIGGWFLSTEHRIQSKDMRRHLDWLLSELVQSKNKILALQKQQGITMGINCVWWSMSGQGGPTLWPEQMRLLVELNLECSFDVSFFGEDDNNGTPESNLKY